MPRLCQIQRQIQLSATTNTQDAYNILERARAVLRQTSYCCRAYSGLSQEEDVKLVWPPPDSVLPDLAQLSNDEHNRLSREDAQSKATGFENSRNGRQRASGLRDARSLGHEIRLPVLHQPDVASLPTDGKADAESGSRGLKVQAVSEAFREHGIRAPSFAKANLRKLPTKVLNDLLLSWGHSSDSLAKPERVDLALAALLEAQGNAVPSARRQARDHRVEDAHLPPAEGQPADLDDITPEQVATWLADAKTDAVSVLNVGSKCDFAESIILATGRSTQHVHAAAAAVRWQVGQHCPSLRGRLPYVEGTKGSDWIAVDVGQIVVHVQTEQARSLYGIQDIWEGTSGTAIGSGN